MSEFVPEANLRGRNLSGMNLAGMNLAGANLKDADLTEANLSGANLRGANLTYVYLRDAILIGTDLSGADLTEAISSGANFTRANLRGATLYALLARANLTDADLTGADLASADLPGAFLTDAILTDADLTDAILTGADLTGADLTGADLTGADLTGAHLEGITLTGATLTGTILRHATLTRGDVECEENEGVFSEEQLRALIIDEDDEDEDDHNVAMEVHLGFKSFREKQSDFLNIISQPDVANIGNIFDYIKNAFTENITELFTGTEQKKMLDELDIAITRVKDSGIVIHPDNYQLILKSMKFVFSQEDINFKQNYIIFFLDESCNAYGRGAVSCPNGIVERIVLSIGPAVRAVCSDKGCPNETYEKLDKLFNPRFDIEASASKWWNEESEKEDIENKTPAERKQAFIDYLITEAKSDDSYNESIRQAIINKANEIDYAFKELQLGGKKSQKKKQKKKTQKKKKIQKKNSKKKRKTQKKKRKTQKKK